jgi:hypothetical protein
LPDAEEHEYHRRKMVSAAEWGLEQRAHFLADVPLFGDLPQELTKGSTSSLSYEHSSKRWPHKFDGECGRACLDTLEHAA